LHPFSGNVQYIPVASDNSVTVPKVWSEPKAGESECSDSLLNWIQDVREVQLIRDWSDEQTFRNAKYRDFYKDRARTLAVPQGFLHSRLSPRNPQEHFFALLTETRQKTSTLKVGFQEHFVHCKKLL
jgi:hypothetical protein